MGRQRRVPRVAARTAALAVAGALCLGLLPSSASADPAYPSAQQVERSKARVADTAARVGQVEARLATAKARAAELATGVARAVEAYNGARYRLDQAVQAAELAQQRAAAARGEVTAAQRRLGRFAAAAYRSGGDLQGLTAFLSATGPRDLLDRASAIDKIGASRQHALDDVQAARVVADVLQRRAGRTVTARQHAADAVEQSKRAAESALAEQQRAVADIAAQREQLVHLLAAARNTSVRLERARQAGLERERAERAERARQAELRRQAAARAEARRKAEQAGRDSGSGSSGAGATGSPGGGGSSSGTASGAARAIAYARDQLGKPYVWAADGPDSFDCSGLTMRAWERGGVSLPHYSVAQYEQSRQVALADLRPGDLVFFGSDKTDPGSIYHVGLYIGGGEMIEAPYTGENVRISSIWRDSLFGGARP
ncbi:MAG TPA: NlpC/P60 family protein [Actinomycetes bacterium]